eukprot:1950100-Alexandrium_andersonii.AAC.1
MWFQRPGSSCPILAGLRPPAPPAFHSTTPPPTPGVAPPPRGPRPRPRELRRLRQKETAAPLHAPASPLLPCPRRFHGRAAKGADLWCTRRRSQAHRAIRRPLLDHTQAMPPLDGLRGVLHR